MMPVQTNFLLTATLSSPAQNDAAATMPVSLRLPNVSSASVILLGGTITFVLLGTWWRRRRAARQTILTIR
ncbi:MULTISPECIES: hypothetical protein [Acidiphilium]|uniref:hypothetical protein n=1 Tax=Acidiphilium TaxID=522 RepID=UPI00257E772E|nr:MULTISPECIES: hypothetical protein [Acidiphilium]HQT83664.1 hypothetical protein [Acidiphilium rubrum]